MTEQIKQKQDGPVRPDMTVGDVVSQFPEAVPIMLRFGLHCVGCHVSMWETLEEGAIGHGMPQDVFETMLKEINSMLIAAGPTADTADMQDAADMQDDMQKSVTITEAAAQKITEMAQKDGRPNAILRVRVLRGGCTGFKYDLDFADTPEQDDITVEAHGIKAVIDPESMAMLAGSTIDHIDSVRASGFKIENPRLRKSCGCGGSFG